MPAVTTAIAVGSAITSAVSSFRKGRAQQKLAQERAQQKRLQQLEIQRRNESEMMLIREQASGVISDAMVTYAGSGIDIGSGASGQARMQSYENLGRVILNKEFESKFRIAQLSVEERWEIKQGNAFKNASLIDGFSALIGGAAKLGGGFMSKTPSLGVLETGDTFRNSMDIDPNASIGQA